MPFDETIGQHGFPGFLNFRQEIKLVRLPVHGTLVVVKIFNDEVVLLSLLRRFSIRLIFLLYLAFRTLVSGNKNLRR